MKTVNELQDVIEVDFSVSLLDHNEEPYVKQDGSPLTMKDVVIASLGISDPNHEDKMERAWALDAVKNNKLNEDQLELIKKWVVKTVPSPSVCLQIVKAL